MAPLQGFSGSGDGDEDPLLDFDDNEENDPIPQEDPDIIFLNESNIAACLVKSRSDYVRFRCNGTDTDRFISIKTLAP